MTSRSIRIGNYEIGLEHKPFIIAEISGNHNQSLERALEIVDAVAETGAQALKIQTYTADTMTLDINENEFFISNEDSPWKGSSLYDLYQKAHTPWDWHAPIFQRAKDHGMVAFSSPFDESAIDFLEQLDVPCYKIASFECTDLPLIRRAAITGKPLIISTGMATIAEIDEAVHTARQAGCLDLILLKCTSTYPASPSNTNNQTIPHMKELFGCEAGLSDHTLGIGAAVAAVALGATVIEKHFTLGRNDGGVDSAFSLEPTEMNSLVIETERAWASLGKVHYGPSDAEKASQEHRRSIYISKDLKKGDVLSNDNIRIVRPGSGLAPKFFDLLIGRAIRRDVKKGTPINWDIV